MTEVEKKFHELENIARQRTRQQDQDIRANLTLCRDHLDNIHWYMRTFYFCYIILPALALLCVLLKKLLFGS